MSGTLVLGELREAAIKNVPIKFQIWENDEKKQETDSIRNATHIQLGDSEDKVYNLDMLTSFYNEDKPQSLRAVIFCWLHDKSSIVDYKNECLELKIPDFKFLVKTELTTWLNGNSDTCTFIKDDKLIDKVSKVPELKKPNEIDDPQLTRILQYERESIDHNAALRGSKNIDFGYLVSDAKKFVNQLKRTSSSSSNSQIKKQQKSSVNLKQPIIIISPATTALLSLSNIKEFLENGNFVEPNPQNKQTGGLVTIHHQSDNLISQAHQIMVVDNVDMFTKPEYWDRVIAIFTTGQAWQFSKYKYSKPEQLFQKYSGFYLGYQGDLTPQVIKNWNVKEIKVDRGEKRFRDKMLVRDFWFEIEKILIAKGYGK
jgi:parafibromin